MGLNLTRKKVLRIAIAVFAAHTMLYIIMLPQSYLYNLQSQNPVNWTYPVSALAINIYVWILITPLALWLGYRFPVRQQNLWRNLLLHLLFAVGSGIIHHLFYRLGGLAFGFITFETFTHSLFNIATIFSFISSSFIRYAMIIAVQQAYLYFRESQERSFRLQQAELKVLKTQLQPHFLFNTLNAISALVGDSPKTAKKTIAELSDLLRLSLKGGKSQEVTLKDELDFLRKYVQIQQTLLQERLDVCWEIDPQTLDAAVPNMILQPLVENAITHGISPLENGGKIEISAQKQNKKLHLRVTDNGQGFSSQVIESNNGGIGLTNTKERLRHLYNAEQEFDLSKSPGGGVEVNISIPFRELIREEILENGNSHSDS